MRTVGFCEIDPWWLGQECPLGVLRAMHPSMAVAAERDAVINIQPPIGINCPRRDVMSAERVPRLGSHAAPLAGEGVSVKHPTSPLAKFRLVLTARSVRFRNTTTPTGIQISSDAVALAGVWCRAALHRLISAFPRAETPGRSVDRIDGNGWRYAELITATLTRQFHGAIIPYSEASC